MLQDVYQKAIAFAARAHGNQLVPGSQLPYVVHLSNVAMEVLAVKGHESFDVSFAVTCALLHDVLEDTEISSKAVEDSFGVDVLRGIQALAKNNQLPKQAQMADSLARILQEPREVAMVKMADRITNLQPPPSYWSLAKRVAYHEEAGLILEKLAPASASLAKRLGQKREAYRAFLVDS